MEISQITRTHINYIILLFGYCFKSEIRNIETAFQFAAKDTHIETYLNDS